MTDVATAHRQVNPQVVDLDDAGDQSINAHGHQRADRDEHAELYAQRRRGDGSQGDDDDLGRQNEIGANSALDLVLLEGYKVDFRVSKRFLSCSFSSSSARLWKSFWWTLWAPS